MRAGDLPGFAHSQRRRVATLRVAQKKNSPVSSFVSFVCVRIEAAKAVQQMKPARRNDRDPLPDLRPHALLQRDGTSQPFIERNRIGAAGIRTGRPRRRDPQ